jgi:hypothetical protein
MVDDISFHWSEYIKTGTEAFVLLKALYPLLPLSNRDDVAAKIEAAEIALQKADAALAQAYGFKLHDCKFPPQIMLWNEQLKERVCQNCGHTTNSKPRPPEDYRDSFISVRD